MPLLERSHALPAHSSGTAGVRLPLLRLNPREASGSFPPQEKLALDEISVVHVPLQERIHVLGLESSARLCGFQKLEDLDGCIAACDVVLNLRAPTFGETSGIMMRGFGLRMGTAHVLLGAGREFLRRFSAFFFRQRGYGGSPGKRSAFSATLHQRLAGTAIQWLALPGKAHWPPGQNAADDASRKRGSADSGEGLLSPDHSGPFSAVASTCCAPAAAATQFRSAVRKTSPAAPAA